MDTKYIQVKYLEKLYRSKDEYRTFYYHFARCDVIDDNVNYRDAFISVLLPNRGNEEKTIVNRDFILDDYTDVLQDIREELLEDMKIEKNRKSNIEYRINRLETLLKNAEDRLGNPFSVGGGR